MHVSVIQTITTIGVMQVPQPITVGRSSYTDKANIENGLLLIKMVKRKKEFKGNVVKIIRTYIE